jgi:23S rRNA pseudouridine2457 synthase
MQQEHCYFVIHKPYGMESQFKPNFPGALLGDLGFDFPEGTHAIGRLDKTSEGLLLLTTNKTITKRLFQGPVPHRRIYFVQVRRLVTPERLEQLRSGVRIRISGDEWYTTPPCEVDLTDPPPYPSPRNLPPQLQSTWLRITLTEGKFRQVRKMVAAIHHPCIRLLRESIEDLHLDGLQAGQVRTLDEASFFRLLKLS